MLLAAISFIPQMDHEEGELVLVAEDYLTALVKNGQILGNFVSGWVDGVYTAYVHASHRDANKPDAASQWVRRTEQLACLQYGVLPECQIVDDETSFPVPQLSSAGFLYLMTHAVHEGSPVWHGHKGTCLPMPLLPVSDRLKEDLYHWTLLCRSYDQIWMMDGPLADSAWYQLSAWNSELYVEARRLAKQLQAETSTPCFIYLWNDFPDRLVSNNANTPTSTACPGCGTNWQIDHQQLPNRAPFRKFHLRCSACQIVSHQPQEPWEEPDQRQDLWVESNEPIPAQGDSSNGVTSDNAPPDDTPANSRISGQTKTGQTKTGQEKPD